MFVLAVFFLVEKNQKIWQSLLFCYSSLFVLTFIAGASPFDTKKRNRVEVLNEFNVLLVGYLSM